jgi:Ser/Thr protein kinase RdoA (MazF antagonist)
VSDVISITEKKSMSEPWPIDPRLIDTVLRSYRRLLIGNLSCRAAERPGFSGAIVLRIEIAAGVFCLRGWPRGVDNEAKILALHEFLAYVGSRGINYLAIPVASDDGHTLVRAEDRFWQLEPWLPGSADFWSRPSDLRLTTAFRALAHLHQVAAEFRPASGKLSHLGSAAPAIAPAARDRLELIDRWTPSRLGELRERPGRAFGVSEPTFADVAGRIVAAFERCAPRVARELRAATQERVPLQPCLRDVWHDHVLFEGDAVTGLIDPSAARTDTVATDLSRLAGSLIADDRRAWDIALGAYCSIRPLSAAEHSLVGVLDRSGVLLSGMGWLERPFAFDQPAEFQSRVLERLERIAVRAEALARSIE